MIKIDCRSQDSRSGVGEILGIEKIANAFCDSSGPADGTIVFGEMAAKKIGITGCREQKENIIYLDTAGLGELFNSKDRSILKEYHRQAYVAVPCSGYVTADGSGGSAGILLRDKDGRAILIKKGNLIWSGLDIGESFFSLITEKYASNGAHNEMSKKDLVSNRLVQAIYYNMPSVVRTFVQRAYYRRLDARLKKIARSRFVTDYPIDIAGWVLIRLLLSLIKELDGFVVSVGKWPKPFKGAFALTHDVEPTKFSYTKGLKLLLDAIDGDKRETHMLDLVGHHANKFLKESESVFRIRGYPAMSHGYYHDGAKPYLPYAEICSRMAKAKTALEGLLDAGIEGYRSPRYERSASIFKGIRESGYCYSSTCPDTDRGNTVRYGGGVAVNYPFYHAIEGSGQKLLEIPITSPDCIEPLLKGETVDGMYDMYRTKFRYMSDIDGVYVCIVHAGNFDEADADTRTALLKFVTKEAEGLNLWRTNLDYIYKWWRERGNIDVKVVGDSLLIFNRNNVGIKDMVVVYESRRDGGIVEYPVSINPNSQQKVPVKI